MGIIIGAAAASIPGLVKCVVDFIMQRSEQSHELQMKFLELEYEAKRAAFLELLESIAGICFPPVQVSSVSALQKHSQRVRVFLSKETAYELDAVMAQVNGFTEYEHPHYVACSSTQRLAEALRKELQDSWCSLKKESQQKDRKPRRDNR